MALGYPTILYLYRRRKVARPPNFSLVMVYRFWHRQISPTKMREDISEKKPAGATPSAFSCNCRLDLPGAVACRTDCSGLVNEKLANWR
jgi:hypothetical protein